MRPRLGHVAHNLIQNPELISRLRRALGIRQGSISPTLNEGLQAVVVVADATENAELGAASRRSAYWFATNTPAIGMRDILQVRNPPGSQVVLNFRRAVAWSDAANAVGGFQGIFTLGWNSAGDDAAIVAPTRFANRTLIPGTDPWNPNAVPRATQLVVIQAAAVGVFEYARLHAAQKTVELNLDGLVIPPGMVFTIQPMATSAAGTTTSFMALHWNEFPQTP